MAEIETALLVETCLYDPSLAETYLGDLCVVGTYPRDRASSLLAVNVLSFFLVLDCASCVQVSNFVSAWGSYCDAWAGDCGALAWVSGA